MIQPAPAQCDTEYRQCNWQAIEFALCADGSAVGRPRRPGFDWPALTFWLSYFSLYSVAGWTMASRCVEWWCR